jgi:hypothetical protein
LKIGIAVGLNNEKGAQKNLLTVKIEYFVDGDISSTFFNDAHFEFSQPL